MMTAAPSVHLLRDILEPEGYAMIAPSRESATGRHLLFLPTGLTVDRNEDDPGGAHTGLSWEAWESTWIPPDDARECLWQFVRMAGTPRWESLQDIELPSRELPRSILSWEDVPIDATRRFMTRWGLLGVEECIHGDDAPARDE